MSRKMTPWMLAGIGLVGFMYMLRKRDELDAPSEPGEPTPKDDLQTGGIPDVEDVREKVDIGVLKGITSLPGPPTDVDIDEMEQALNSLTAAQGGPSLGKFWLVEKKLGSTISLARKTLGVGSGDSRTMPYVAAMKASQWNQVTYGDSEGSIKPAFMPWNFDPVAAFYAGGRAARALTPSGGPRKIPGAKFYGLLWLPQIDNAAFGDLGRIVVVQQEPPQSFFSFPNWTP